MTGRSGGGAITWFTAAVDDRFKAAAPVHGDLDRRAACRRQTRVRENCDCIYFWNTYQLDLPLVGALDRSASVEDRQREQGRVVSAGWIRSRSTSACARSTNGMARRRS